MNLILIKTFATVAEAEAARGLLEAHGIKAIFQTVNPGSTGYLGNLAGGELYIKPKDADTARDLLST